MGNRWSCCLCPPLARCRKRAGGMTDFRLWLMGRRLSMVPAVRGVPRFPVRRAHLALPIIPAAQSPPPRSSRGRNSTVQTFVRRLRNFINLFVCLDYQQRLGSDRFLFRIQWRGEVTTTQGAVSKASPDRCGVTAWKQHQRRRSLHTAGLDIVCSVKCAAIALGQMLVIMMASARDLRGSRMHLKSCESFVALSSKCSKL